MATNTRAALLMMGRLIFGGSFAHNGERRPSRHAAGLA